jgi:hypothetical protein
MRSSALLLSLLALTAPALAAPSSQVQRAKATREAVAAGQVPLHQDGSELLGKHRVDGRPVEITKGSDGVVFVSEARGKIGQRYRLTGTAFKPDGRLADMFIVSRRGAGESRYRFYHNVGRFDVPGVASGTALVARLGAGKRMVRFQSDGGATPFLDGTRRVTLVVGPRQGWTPASPTLERKSLSVRGDAAYATFTDKELTARLGTTDVAVYARIEGAGGAVLGYVNVDGQAGQNFSLQGPAN